MILYRIGNWCYQQQIPFFPKFFNFLIRLFHNSAVFTETKIGSGTRFGYGGIGVVIHRRVVIGKNCMIGSNVTVGGRGGDCVPTIGDNVYIATGAKILGGVTIGSNVKIGANAVVLSDIPSGATAVGVPARVIK